MVNKQCTLQQRICKAFFFACGITIAVNRTLKFVDLGVALQCPLHSKCRRASIGDFLLFLGKLPNDLPGQGRGVCHTFTD